MSRINSAKAKYAILFFGCVLFHIAGTWNLPLIDRDEPRFAEATREMIERGDYVVPHFNGQLRLDKPPLTYWAQVASYKIFGENDFAARFPSTIAAALVALSVFSWGKRIGGEKVGWWAAIIFTLSLQTFVHAKAAVADMWLVLFVTTANWAGWEIIKSRESEIENRKIAHWLAFYISLALGFLAKGPIAWIPLLTVGSIIVLTREWRVARRFKFVAGILLMLAVVACWGVPALMQTHGEFFYVGIDRHVIGRSFGAMEGHGANSFGMYLLFLPFYFVTIFISFFPWSIKLPWLTKTLWRKRDSTDDYFIVGIAIIFIIFTLVKTKLPHYTFPAFPLLALLLARRWAQRETTHFNAIAITTALVLGVIALVVPPLVARFVPAYALFQKSRDSLRADMQFGAVDFNEPSLVWYFRSRVKTFLMPLNKRSAADFMSQTGPRFVIIPSSFAPALKADRADWKTFYAHGINIAKGKRVDLTLILKPE